MPKLFAVSALAALLSLPLLAAPTAASASCQDRKLTGTVIGGLGGALVGNSISKGGGGAVVGGLGGAVLGHEIAKSGCGSSYRRTAYRDRHSRYAASQSGEPARNVYYDQYGNPIAAPAPAPYYNR